MVKLKYFINVIVISGAISSVLFFLLLIIERLRGDLLISEQSTTYIGALGFSLLFLSYPCSKLYWKLEINKRKQWINDVKQIVDYNELVNLHFSIEDLADYYNENERRIIKREVLNMEEGKRRLKETLDVLIQNGIIRAL